MYQQQPGYNGQPVQQPGYNGQPVQQPGYNGQPVQQGYMPPNGPAAMNIPPPAPGMAVQWMPKPNPIPGCPPGLEYLTQIDRILVQQKVDLLEAFTGWDENNRYVVRNVAGQQIYYAFEKTDTCMRICCEAQRGFTIHIVDNFNQECLRIKREFKCCAGNRWCAGCCDCCAHEVQIETPNGQVLGYIKQKGSFQVPKFHILDESKKPLYQIEGPCCIFNGAFSPCDNEFIVMSMDGNSPNGKITKKYGGFAQEMFTNADNFSVEFPISLPVNVKATLFGALFLIDFMFFEHQDKDNNGHRGHHHSYY